MVSDILPKRKTGIKTAKEDVPIRSIVRIVDTDYSIKVDDSDFVKSRAKFAQVQGWEKRPSKGTKNLQNTSSWKQLDRSHGRDKKDKPLKNYVVYPSTDPYSGTLRQLLKTINEECPWIDGANEKIQELVMSPSHREAMPRANMELRPEQLEKWQEKPIFVPFFDKDMAPKEVEKEIDQLAETLDFDNLMFDAYGFVREQGRSCIAMFPELRNKKTGKYVIPEALTVIRPQFLRRPIKSQGDGSLVGIETTGLTSNGSLLDANRAVYIFNGKNHDQFADFYGKSPIRSLVDLAQNLLIIYGRDYQNIVINTYRTPNVWRHTLPTKDLSVANPILDDFNATLANNQDKDISITHNVELVNPSGTNAGDIDGVNAVQNECVDGILGKLNIPPFIFGKGKPGRLGGNANLEEIEAFQTGTIKPQQELLQSNAEKQFYDRILAIYFDVEPEDADDPDLVPIKIEHTYEKPNIAIPFNLDLANTLMVWVQEGLTTNEQAFEKMGLRDLLMDDKDDIDAIGGDSSPSIKTWKHRSHSTWEPKRRIRPQITKDEEWHNHKEFRSKFPISRTQKADEVADAKIDTLKAIQDKIKDDRKEKKKNSKK